MAAWNFATDAAAHQRRRIVDQKRGDRPVRLERVVEMDAQGSERRRILAIDHHQAIGHPIGHVARQGKLLGL